MHRPTYLLFVFLLLPTNGFGQNPPEQRQEVRDRWTRAQPAILLYSGGEVVLRGQPLWITEGGDSLVVQKGSELPLAVSMEGNTGGWPVTGIDSFAFQRGGTRAFRAHQATLFYPDKTGFEKLSKGMVYQEDPGLVNVLDEAFPHSRLLRRTYPKKHFRFSASFGNAPWRPGVQAPEAFEGSPLGSPANSYSQALTVSFIDISFRFFDRFILGFDLAVLPTDHDHYWDDYYSENDYYASFYTSFLENKIYAEYAIIPVDRFLSSRFELLAGASLLLGVSDWNMYYNVYFPDPTPGDGNHEGPYGDEASYRNDGELVLGGGFSLRAHYYLFPGMSLFGGLEGSFYPWIHTGPMEFPAYPVGTSFSVDDVALNYTCLRFRLGLSLYL